MAAQATAPAYIYLVHDFRQPVCMHRQPGGHECLPLRLALPGSQGDGPAATYAQQDDFSLRLDFAKPVNKTTLRGNGLIGGWQDSSSDNSLWNGVSTTKPKQ